MWAPATRARLALHSELAAVGLDDLPGDALPGVADLEADPVAVPRRARVDAAAGRGVPDAPAGASVLVTGTAVFGQKDCATAIRASREGAATR